MRHNRKRRKLNRTTSERKALFKSLVTALLIKQRINTTVSKAKEARRLAEKVITLGKRADLASQRRLFSILLDKSLVKEVVSEIAPRFKNRQGGYTRIIRLSKFRKGDNAEIAMLELTEQKVIAPPSKKSKKEKKPEAVEQKPEKGQGEEPPKETPLKKEEKYHPRDEKKPPVGKPKKGFFQGLQRFLKPKTGTG